MPLRFMLASPMRQVCGAVSWLAQLPSGAIVGVNDYRLIGDTAQLADLYHRGGYMHGRWSGGMVRLGTQARQLSAGTGDCHYAIVQQADVPLQQRTQRTCRGIFTTPTAVDGAGRPGSATGTLDMVWEGACLHLRGRVEVQVDGARTALAIEHIAPRLGVVSHGGSLFGGGEYTLTPVVAHTGMLRCVVLYRVQFPSGVRYHGIVTFEGSPHLRTQNMYTKN